MELNGQLLYAGISGLGLYGTVVQTDAMLWWGLLRSGALYDISAGFVCSPMLHECCAVPLGYMCSDSVLTSYFFILSLFQICGQSPLTFIPYMSRVTLQWPSE